MVRKPYHSCIEFVKRHPRKLHIENGLVGREELGGLLRLSTISTQVIQIKRLGVRSPHGRDRVPSGTRLLKSVKYVNIMKIVNRGRRWL